MHFPYHLPLLIRRILLWRPPSVEQAGCCKTTYGKFLCVNLYDVPASCTDLHFPRLLEKVIDIEISKHTQSPTVDPSVHTILIGHSMGGIVAADTLLALTSDRPISGSSDSNDNVINTVMFPHIQGVLAFDTPYLGISSGVAAHPLEEHYKTASAAITQLSGLSGMIWGGSAAAATDSESEKKKNAGSSSAPPAEAAAVPAWQRWGKIAMYAGAAGAVAAGGAAAYMKRDQITEGWSWVGSHLEFVGCLMRGEDLKKRMSGVIRLNKEMGIGFADIYTRLGKKAQNQEGNMVGSIVGNQRTFCNLPKKDAIVYFHEAINDAASDETSAHMSKLRVVQKRRMPANFVHNSYVFSQRQSRLLCHVSGGRESDRVMDCERMVFPHRRYGGAKRLNWDHITRALGIVPPCC